MGLLNDEAHAEAAFDAALLAPHHPAAAFDCWWRVEVPDLAAVEFPGSCLEQPLPRCLPSLCFVTSSCSQHDLCRLWAWGSQMELVLPGAGLGYATAASCMG